MKNKKANKGKHLTLEDRHNIEDALSQKFSLKAIADRLEKDPTTISKEIRRNRITSRRNSTTDIIGCEKRRECTMKNLCSKSCHHLCKKCPTLNCLKICPNYSPIKCQTLLRFPHVCNGCARINGCRSEKQYYRAKVADANYQDLLKSSREGIDIMPHELSKLDDLISPRVLKGQSLTHIFANHHDEIPCSERTLYNYFDQNILTARNIDLPRKVKYKPRKKAPDQTKRVQPHRLGRTYDDFKAFIELNPETSIVEMDTVYGRKGGKVLLTFFFRKCSLMLAFLMESCTQECVKTAIDWIYDELGMDVFRNSFPVVLTDNGSEFKSPESIEYDDKGLERTKVFYCDPMSSYQKPHIEKNHEYIRYILPKGRTFKMLTQEKVTLAMNHINSAARASLNGTTPFKLAQLLLDASLLEKLSLIEIPADEVHLKPALLK
ncbi:IS30 family transposase [Dehalobacter sp.]|uniref:IS30 family transposase n=1 Tax=Dehalobacter sp. TaxID=1962289 RepID=UPI00258F1414|nr:IS30 family transposase [Dehalobacter sp.]MCG1025144.1 IS30 family transposase [Dehalobacter sp.]